MPTPIIGALPVTLTNGTIADATQVMADFNYILSQVNANAAPVAGGTYLPLGGGTMTGNLTIAPSGTSVLTLTKSGSGFANSINATNGGLLRWQMVLGDGGAEGGANSGSDFEITRFNDSGAVIDSPLMITRSNGQTTFAGTVLCTNPGSQLTISGSVATNRVFNFSTGGSGRWQHVCTAGAEGGSNAGSDYVFQALADTGTVLAQVWSVVRSTQIVTFTKAIVNGPSDRSLKENIAPLEDSLAKVLKLQGVSFNLIADEDKRRHIGLIAQDVAPIVPEVIQEFRSGVDGEEPKLALDYPKLTALLIEAIKTLTTRIETLEAKLAIPT